MLVVPSSSSVFVFSGSSDLVVSGSSVLAVSLSSVFEDVSPSSVLVGSVSLTGTSASSAPLRKLFSTSCFS
ncbi:hypothetical protein [uncultured Aquimarina sp.]|uniref:hypothetical protein n=1 Tax=uncultured Aquimarina sp. TaxID=575652 RepID=UPI0026152AAF|nr:hypothetical protein [uncultured Aquimarina sp.]